jgi:hypothetical protein
VQIRNEHDEFYQKGELTKHNHKAHKRTQGEMAYRKAIIAAIDNMGDNHLRSSIEEIEKHVKANIPSDCYEALSAFSACPDGTCVASY